MWSSFLPLQRTSPFASLFYVRLTSSQVAQQPTGSGSTRPDRGHPTRYGWWTPVTRAMIRARTTRFVAATLSTYTPYRSRVSALLGGSTTATTSLRHRRPSPPLR